MAYVGKITGTDGTTGLVGSTLYGTCATAAGTAAKVVTCTDFDKLITGVTIHVKFTNSNTASNPTLNVNGTGALRIYRYGTTSPGTTGAWSWYSGAVVSLTYDGSAWIMNDMIGYDNNYDRTSIQMRMYAGTNGVFPYSIVAMDKNQRMQAMTTTGGDGTSKAFNSSQKFMYPPYIFYHSENATKTNGKVITNNVLYEQYPNVNMTYSCNITTSSGFTQYMPVYIECTFDSFGYWSPTGITQTFTEGKYYILLGSMYSTSIYQVALTAQHPVFYYDGEKLTPVDDRYINAVPTSETNLGCYDIEQRSHTFYHSNNTIGLRVYNRPSGFVNFSQCADLMGLSSSVDSLLSFRWGDLMDDVSEQYELPLKILLTPNNITVGDGILKTNLTTTPNGFSSAVTYGMNLSLDPDVIDRKGVAYYNTGWTTPAPTNVWAKVGSYTSSASGVSNQAMRTVFLVSNYNNSINKNVGILVCSTVIGPQTETNAELKWLFADTTTDPDDFVLVLTESTSGDTKTATVELWVKWTRGWQSYTFKPLIEHIRAGTTLYWTFNNARPADGQASYTSGTTTVVSSVDSLNATVASANKLNTNAGSATQPVYFSSGVPVAVTQPASGAWFSSVPKIDSSGVLEIGRYIDFHSSNTGTSNYDYRIDASSTSLMTISSSSGNTALRVSGTLPKLRFTQTTSGKEFDNENCGITANPAGTDGIDMTIQSGGRMIVGGGEYPVSFYNLASKIYYDYWSVSSECCYIGADSAVIVHTNYSTPSQRKNFIFTAGGNFAVPPGGYYYFSNTLASDANAGIYHKLVHAAGTDSTATGFAARTWTLPDKSGTVAMTSDLRRGGSLYCTSRNNTYWGKVMSIVMTSNTTCNVLLSVTQGLGDKSRTTAETGKTIANVGYKGAGILQVSCAVTSGLVCSDSTSCALWLVAGGNITPANFKLIAKNNTPATDQVTFELWIKNTGTYHPWLITPMCETNVTNRGEYFTFYDPRNSDVTTTTPTGDSNFTSTFFTPVTS